MRTALSSLFLPFAAWLGVLQVLATRGPNLEDTVRYVSIAGVLGTLTVLVYRLGVWRQEIENTKHSLSTDVKQFQVQSINTVEDLASTVAALETLFRKCYEHNTNLEGRWLDLRDRLEKLEWSSEEAQ